MRLAVGSAGWREMSGLLHKDGCNVLAEKVLYNRGRSGGVYIHALDMGHEFGLLDCHICGSREKRSK